MDLITTIYEHDLYPERPEVDASDFRQRKAARAIVFDGAKVALLKVSKLGYYKLPGGGIEDGESVQDALAREVLEEIGCHIHVTAEVGQVVEHRSAWQLKQTSYCYVAQKVGEATSPSFTEEEAENGFEIVWAPTLHEAIKLVVGARSTDYEAPFIKERDSKLLIAAGKYAPKS